MVPANREESTARDDLAVSDELKDVSQGALRWCRVRITHDVNMTSLHGHCACVTAKNAATSMYSPANVLALLSWSVALVWSHTVREFTFATGLQPDRTEPQGVSTWPLTARCAGVSASPTSGLS